jgi:hypothetical protein
MCPQIASGRDYSILQNDESTVTLECGDKHRILSRVMSLAETACGLESTTSAE